MGAHASEREDEKRCHDGRKRWDNALPNATADGSAPTDANTDASALTCLYIIALRALGVQRIGDEPDADDDERQAQ